MIFFLLLEDIKIPLIGEHEKVTHEADGLIISLISSSSSSSFFFAVQVTNKFPKELNFYLILKKNLTSFPTTTTSRAMIRTMSATARQ